MAYTPDPNRTYLPRDWAGTVTANDIAIQNQPWSLGQHLGPTREQAAQQELEAWFRSQGLDPNQYYEAAGVTPPQPGFNPAGGSVNIGKPLKQQTIWSGGRTAEQAAAQAQANKQFEKLNEVRFDRKAAALPGGTATFRTGAAAVPIQSQNQSFLPPYLQPGGGTNQTGMAPVNSVTGAPPVNPIGAPPLLGAPLVTGGINTGAGFGKTAKMLDLPYYLRGNNKGFGIRT